MSAYTEGRDLALMFKYYKRDKLMNYERKFFDWLAGYRRDLLRGEFREKLVDYLTESYYKDFTELTPEKLKEVIKYEGFCVPINDYELDELIMEVPIEVLNKVFQESEALKARADELYKDFEQWKSKLN